MSKGNVTINITKDDYVFIDGATGEELTKEEFDRRHKAVPASNLGINRPNILEEAGKGTTEEIKE